VRAGTGGGGGLGIAAIDNVRRAAAPMLGVAIGCGLVGRASRSRTSSGTVGGRMSEPGGAGSWRNASSLAVSSSISRANVFFIQPARSLRE
jgi:hypothetical protein